MASTGRLGGGRRLGIAMALAAAAAGCRATGQGAAGAPGGPSAEPNAPVDVAPPTAADTVLALELVLERAATVGHAVIGRSVEGRPIELLSLGPGPEVLLLIATIHGDEAAGTPLLDRLADELLANPLRLSGRRVLLVGVANPDGYAADSRENARDVDLNRNFAAANRVDGNAFGDEGLSEPESAALAALIQAARPARVVSIHQPLRCVDWDGPAEDLARRMATSSGLPARKLGTRPGSMGAWVGEELGIPIITLELPGGAQRLETDELWRRYGEALLIAVQG